MSDKIEKKETYVEANYVCVHCGEPKQKLIRIFAESAMLLQTCVKCNQPVDKYIEYDFTLVFIDILLLKLTAYRHILFNTTNKTFLLRLVALTILSTSYVQWVFEKQLTENKSSLPVFYELEWGYYTVILYQTTRVIAFTCTFLLCGFLSSLSGNAAGFPFWHTLEGVAISYCWRLMCVPSLVWNHYTMYSSLSQVAMLISCHHTFLVCTRQGIFYSIPSIALAFGMQWSANELVQSLLT